jgi:dihydrodipicolinate synthase/N-acetylneuraminate lyase
VRYIVRNVIERARLMKRWSGVFPATTTQFNKDSSLNVGATQEVVSALIRDGVHGIICMGTVGENCSLLASEKRTLLGAVKEVAAGRVPVLSGVAECTTQLAVEYARDAERIGIDGLMVLPGMVYKSSPRETLQHFRTVAAATGLPIMIYNNPVSYGVDVTVAMFQQLSDVRTIVALKESSEDTRRLTDLRNACGDRYILFAGVDDIALESLMLGADGWISGLTNVFPRESVALYALARAGRYREALELYRWFMPLLHLDTVPTLVQCIKLAEQVMGRGSETVRAPRLTLEGDERAYVERVVREAEAKRPVLPAM